MKDFFQYFWPFSGQQALKVKEVNHSKLVSDISISELVCEFYFAETPHKMSFCQHCNTFFEKC